MPKQYETPPEDLILRRAFELPRTRRNRLLRWERWKQEQWDRQDNPEHQGDQERQERQERQDIQEDLAIRVHDHVALEEIELYAEVLGAVAASHGPLTKDKLNEVLGVRPQSTTQESRQQARNG